MTSMLPIKIYGRLADEFGPVANIDVMLPCSIDVLRGRMGGAVADPRILFAVAGQIVGGDYLIEEGQQVEMLSPLSGG
nr:hypothetical protein [uncultured Sphingomonas sp.]